jgi:uncharacterized protein YfdQ (DUF2303 family)
MEKDKKKIAAALAAVTLFIKTQEEAALASAEKPVEAAAPVQIPPMVFPSAWRIAGRQDIMQMRSLMQMKAFHGAQRK